MKNFYLILVLLFLFVNVGCDQIPQDEKAVNNVISRNSKMLAEKYHMKPVGVGIAMPGGDIKYLNLEFQIYGPLSKDDIRKLLIHAAHDFLADINSDSELCSYLKNHSLTIQDIGIVLFLIDSSGRGLRDPYIGIAEISHGKLRYDVLIEKYDDVIKKTLPKIIYECNESYEEAMTYINIQN